MPSVSVRSRRQQSSKSAAVDLIQANTITSYGALLLLRSATALERTTSTSSPPLTWPAVRDCGSEAGGNAVWTTAAVVATRVAPRDRGTTGGPRVRRRPQRHCRRPRGQRSPLPLGSPTASEHYSTSALGPPVGVAGGPRTGRRVVHPLRRCAGRRTRLARVSAFDDGYSTPEEAASNDIPSDPLEILEQARRLGWN